MKKVFYFERTEEFRVTNVSEGYLTQEEIFEIFILEKINEKDFPDMLLALQDPNHERHEYVVNLVTPYIDEWNDIEEFREIEHHDSEYFEFKECIEEHDFETEKASLH